MTNEDEPITLAEACGSYPRSKLTVSTYIILHREDNMMPLSTSTNSSASFHWPPLRKSSTALRCASRPRPLCPCRSAVDTGDAVSRASIGTQTSQDCSRLCRRRRRRLRSPAPATGRRRPIRAPPICSPATKRAASPPTSPSCRYCGDRRFCGDLCSTSPVISFGASPLFGHLRQMPNASPTRSMRVGIPRQRPVLRGTSKMVTARSPTTTRPVAMPTRVCRGAWVFRASTAATNSGPARTARSASSSCACG